jgi:hypothetical protein
MDDAIAYLRSGLYEIADENLKRLSPLRHERIKMLGNSPSSCSTISFQDNSDGS